MSDNYLFFPNWPDLSDSWSVVGFVISIIVWGYIMIVITNLLESDMSFIKIAPIAVICFLFFNLVVEIIVVELEARADKIGTNNAYLAVFYTVAFFLIVAFVKKLFASHD